MARVKRAVHARKKRKKVLAKASGYYGNKSRSFRAANEQVMHSGNYAFRDRKARKGEFPPSVDPAHQCWMSYARHHLQPVHARPEAGRGRS